MTNFGSIQLNVGTSVQVEITHPLQQVLQMGLVRLEDLLHDGALLKQVGESCHMLRIEQIDFQEVPVADMVTKERKGVIDGISKCFDVSLNFNLAQTFRIWHEEVRKRTMYVSTYFLAVKCAFNRTRKMSRWSAMIAKDDAWNHREPIESGLQPMERHRRVADMGQFNTAATTFFRTPWSIPVTHEKRRSLASRNDCE
ncbi:hypothetical protein KC368_g93 [Hortaea werneckii]|nr:hypothetical protein KC368_g93 [Hortaea werneckii]